MNITRENIDALNALLKVHVEEADYKENLEKALRDYKKKIHLPGFRNGKIPLNLIKKLTGNALIAEELNKMLPDTITNYINTNSINILGAPLPSDKNSQIDFITQKDFDLFFDIGISPDIKLSLSKDIKVAYNSIILDNKMIDNKIEHLRSQYGEIKISEISDEESLVVGGLVQLDDTGNKAQSGIAKDKVMLLIKAITDEDIKLKFTGLKKNDTLSFDIRKAFSSHADISSLLGIKIEDVPQIQPLFQFTFTDIYIFTQADLNNVLYDKIYGEGNIASYEDFRNRIEQDIKYSLKKESYYKFFFDIKKILKEQSKVELPLEFLKRWYAESYKKENNKNEKNFDNQFDVFIEGLKWQLIKKSIIINNNITILNEDIVNYLQIYYSKQLNDLGIANITDENLDEVLEKLFKKKEEAGYMIEQLSEQKVLDYIIQQITIDNKELVLEEFYKLFDVK
ncbi:MAG: hypothetical protein HY738_04490 [Bacteroidia bacterium]|nr:hypothetical protein [Bacteroidia bacterium]